MPEGLSAENLLKEELFDENYYVHMSSIHER